MNLWPPGYEPDEVRKSIIPCQPDDFTEDDDLVAENRFERVVFRLQAEAAVFFIKPLDGSLVLEKGDDDIAVAGRGRLLGDDDVAVQNAGVQHAFAPDIQGEQRLAAGGAAGVRDIALDLFDGQNRGAGGDGAQQGHMRDILVAAVDADGTLQQGIAGDVAGLLESVEARLHRGGRAQADGRADFAHRGWIAAARPFNQIFINFLLCFVDLFRKYPSFIDINC